MTWLNIGGPCPRRAYPDPMSDPLNMRIAKLRHLAKENRFRALMAGIKGLKGKKAYHLGRASRFEGLAVQLIVERETR